MTIIRNKEELIKFCEENAVGYSAIENTVYLNCGRILRSWNYLKHSDKVIFTQTGFKVYYSNLHYNECLTVKLKNYWVIVKTKNEIIPISEKII